ncbi:MAG: TraB/GumN family protein, partial [Hyphomicrobium sp.]
MLLCKSLANAGALVGVILFSAVLVATHGAAGASTGAPDDKCISRSVLDELDARDRSKLETILKNAGNSSNSQAMLWRIEKAGVDPSYIFGTVHIADEGLQELRPAVREALAVARSVTLEAAELSRGAMQYAMAQAGPLMVATDKPLQRLLEDDELELVERVLVKAGFPAEMALGFRPWAVTMFLADSDCQKKKQEAGYKSLDLLVADAARAKGLKVEGLETMLEQYQTLAAVPETAQTAWLKASIEMHDRIDDISHTMAELYRFRRIDAVWDL